MTFLLEVVTLSISRQPPMIVHRLCGTVAYTDQPDGKVDMIWSKVLATPAVESPQLSLLLQPWPYCSSTTFRPLLHFLQCPSTDA
jgi:hypothetical protein